MLARSLNGGKREMPDGIKILKLAKQQARFCQRTGRALFFYKAY